MLLRRTAFASVTNGLQVRRTGGEELTEVPGPTDYQVLKEVVSLD